jgi:hypothetical protein
LGLAIDKHGARFLGRLVREHDRCEGARKTKGQGRAVELV